MGGKASGRLAQPIYCPDAFIDTNDHHAAHVLMPLDMGCMQYRHVLMSKRIGGLGFCSDFDTLSQLNWEDA